MQLNVVKVSQGGSSPWVGASRCKSFKIFRLVVKTQSLGEASAVNLKFKAVSPLADPRGYWDNRPPNGPIIFLFYAILEKKMAKIIGWRANLWRWRSFCDKPMNRHWEQCVTSHFVHNTFSDCDRCAWEFTAGDNNGNMEVLYFQWT